MPSLSASTIYNYEKRSTPDLSGVLIWNNLLRCDSVLDLLIGNAGYFNFLTHEEDLARLEFSRLHTSLESSWLSRDYL